MASLLAHDINSKERTDDVKIDESITFNTMLLPKFILDGLGCNGFKSPSPIQLAAIPLARCGLDLIVQSKSGTGKTLVFTITALESISVNVKRIQVIVIAPTREIAIQISDVVKSVGKNMKGLNVGTFVGGKPLYLDKPALVGCHIVVGTPGRLRHLMEERILDSEAVRLLVLDEADQLFSGEYPFQKDINFIFNTCSDSKQVLAVSATYPPPLVEFTGRFMRSGQVVTPGGGPAPTLLGLRQFILLTRDHPDYNARLACKEKELLHILSTITFDQCCIFHHYASRAESMNNVLCRKGFSSICLTGKQSMEKRTEGMASLRSGKCRILVTTDLAARGIDSSSINLVVNMGLPWNPATYLHRMGRAGRYGSQGVCISLISEGLELIKFQKLLGQIGGTSMNVNVVPKIRKFDIWNDNLIDFDKVYGVIPLNDDDDDDDESDESNTISSEEVKQLNIDAENKTEITSIANKTSKPNNMISLKELQMELDKFVLNEKNVQDNKLKKIENKENKLKKIENKENRKNIPLSYSQIVSGQEIHDISSSSSSTIPSSYEVILPSPKKTQKVLTNSPGVSLPSAKLSDLRKSKRKRGCADCSSNSSEFESDSFDLDDTDDTMYTVDEVGEDEDTRSGIDLNAEENDFDESISDISCEDCRIDAPQKRCPNCRPAPRLIPSKLTNTQTDWYSVLSKEINDYVLYSRKFRITWD